MAQIIDFPPKLDCPLCGIPLHLATRAEIDEDLRSPDLQRRQIAQSAAQGARDWEPSADWDEWEKAMTPTTTWLFRCDRCDNRTLWSRNLEA